MSIRIRAITLVSMIFAAATVTIVLFMQVAR